MDFFLWQFQPTNFIYVKCTGFLTPSDHAKNMKLPQLAPSSQKQRPARLCRSAESNSCQPPGAGGWTKEARSSPWKVIPHDTKVTNHSYSPINLLNDIKESKKDDPHLCHHPTFCDEAFGQRFNDTIAFHIPWSNSSDHEN